MFHRTTCHFKSKKNPLLNLRVQIPFTSDTHKVVLSVAQKKNRISHNLELAVGCFSFLPFHLSLSASLPLSLHPPSLPLTLPQVSPALALSCVFKVIAHGSQGVCIRACHKQSTGMSRGLVHEPNPVSEAKWTDGGC